MQYKILGTNLGISETQDIQCNFPWLVFIDILMLLLAFPFPKGVRPRRRKKMKGEEINKTVNYCSLSRICHQNDM